MQKISSKIQFVDLVQYFVSKVNHFLISQENRVTSLIVDNAKENIAGDTFSFFQIDVIAIKTSPPYDPEINGIAPSVLFKII